METPSRSPGDRRRYRAGYQGRSLYAVAGALAAAAVVLGACEQAAAPAMPPAPKPDPLAFPAAAAVADRNYLPDRAIRPLTLPAAAGGSGPLTYSLSPEVPGLTFDAGDRTLTGAPTQINEYAMTYAARDQAGDAAQLTFTITVENALRRSAGDQVFFLNPAGEAIDQVEYTLHLGETPADVYLIATHGGDGGAPAPRGKVVELVDTAAGPAAADRSLTSSLRAEPRPPSEPAPDLPWVTEHNNNPPLLVRGAASRSQSAQGTRPQSTVGSRETFTEVLDAGGDFQTITVYNRGEATDGVTTAKVWVDNRVWGCRARQCVNQFQVDEIANRFLRSGPANDIYDWVTAIYGAPWGPHEYTNVIPPSAADTINIVLYDIDGDGLPSPGDARVVGYFSAVHNYLRDGNPPLSRSSSEWLAVILDSPMMTLDMDIAISALAHEFQHMIHFYQKPVLRGADSETWLNEMSSEMAQDLIADKARVDGPRGVAYDDPTAGQPGIRFGRLPVYNRYNDIQVTAWQGSLANYSINYALGAYLARTYGGAELFSRIVQSERAGVDAIEGALRELGHQVSFPRILADWAAAGLLSDDTQAPVPYRYNPGTWSASTAGGADYRLGSINLYHYRRPGGGTGPYLRGLSDFTARPQPPHSNKYARLGRLSGSHVIRLTADAGLRFTVMFKE